MTAAGGPGDPSDSARSSIRALAFVVAPESRETIDPAGSVLELWLVVQGRCAVRAGGTVLHLRESMLYWVFSGQQHQSVRSSPDLHGWRVVVAPELLSLLHSAAGGPVLLPGNGPKLPLTTRISATDVRWLFERLDELSVLPGDGAEFGVGLSYVLLRAWRLRESSQDARPAASAVVLRAVQALRETTWSAPWSVSALARSLDVSAGQLQRRFRAETGQTVTQYRLAVQLARYLDLCDDDHDISITDAAYAAGFGSYAQFHRMFVRYMGVNPSLHRTRRRTPTPESRVSARVPRLPPG